MSLSPRDPMPLHEYHGVPMMNVPATHLHWLWTKVGLSGGRLVTQALKDVSEYIRINIEVLEAITPELTWREF
jgi:uncharacterized protein (DUF3820 family)